MKPTERNAQEGDGNRRHMSVGGRACIAIAVGLMLGLAVAYKTGNESIGFLFGVALMAFLPLAFVYAILEAIASRFRKPR